MNVPNHRTKVDLAGESIRTAIRRGDLRPGQRLDVRDLCDRLSMSPTPVREAMRMLEVQGLLTDEPHRGMSVARPTEENIDDLYELRALLEGYATERAASRLSAEALDDIRAAAEAHRVARLSGDLVTAGERNYDFHTFIYGAAADSTYLMDEIVRLWNRFPWNATWTLDIRTERAIAEHDEIIEALSLREGAVASQLMKRHILATRPALLAALRAGETETPG